MISECSEKLSKWVKKHKKDCKNTSSTGEQFLYENLLSGKVTVQTVKCTICGEVKVDYVS